MFSGTRCVDDYSWARILLKGAGESIRCMLFSFSSTNLSARVFAGVQWLCNSSTRQVSVDFLSPLIPCFEFVQSKAFNQRANQIGFILAQIKDPQEGINSPRFCGHISFASSLCPCCSHQAKEARGSWKRWLTWSWYQLWVALGVWLIVIGWWFCQDRSCIYILNPLTSRQYEFSWII